MPYGGDVNAHHPELRPGEVFLTNIWPGGVKEMAWRTAREGIQGYDSNGKKLKSWRPIFVQKSELEKFGISMASPDRLKKQRRSRP